MNRIEINNELLLPCPDGFTDMTREDLDRVYTSGSPGRAGIRDAERHVMITVLWQRYNAVLAWLADIKSLARRNEQLSRKGYADHDYRLDGFFGREVWGLSGEGYHFTYRVEDTGQEAWTLLIKKGSTVYSLNCVGRPENHDANQAVFEEILDGVKL